MIEVSFACPGCGREASAPDLEAAATLPCPCGRAASRRADALSGGRVARCALCGDPRLFVQKDFSRTMGIGLLVLGFAAAIALGVFVGPWGFFAALTVSVAMDALLYLVAGKVVICHWCGAHYRGGPEDYPEFDLALHDVIRHQKEVVAAGQAVPEHEVHPTEYDGSARP